MAADLGVPTFSHSRTHTDDSDPEGDGSFMTAENGSFATANGDASSVASSNPSSVGAPGGGGANGGSGRKQQLYKTAMTTRARQRRMRRMKSRDGGGANASFDNGGGGEAAVSPSPAGLPPPPPPPGPPPANAHRRTPSGGGLVLEESRASMSASTPVKSNATRALSPPAGGLSSGRSARRFSGRGRRSNTAAGNDDLPVPSSITPLSPDEVRDASNFTSVQFQCSNLSGEVEMFSDDGTGTDSCLSDGGLSASRTAALILSRTNTGASSVFSRDSGRSAKEIAEETEDPEAVAGTYREGTVSWQNDVWSEATTPTLLRNGEIFHRKAAASIVSLLTPGRLSDAGLMAPEAPADEVDDRKKDRGAEDDGDADVNGDSPTGVADPGARGHFTFRDDPDSCRGNEWVGTKAKGGPGSSAGSSVGPPSSSATQSRKLFRDDIVRDDIDDDVKQSLIFHRLRQRMLQPSSQLSDLLSQIQRTPGQPLDRAFAVRRKNACGALKILSGRPENRIKICWTSGVLPALASVLCDVVGEGAGRASDEIARSADDEARVRAVSVLLNLSAERKNRMLIANHPGMLESVGQCVRHDGGEGRQGCCTALLYLSKTSEARGFIVRSGGMMDVLAEVVRVPERNGPDDASGAEDGDGSAAVADPDADFYDAHPNRFLHGARLSVFACLLCLVKSQENAYAVAREGVVVDALIGVSRRRGSPSHARAMAVLAHLTRQAKNCHHLVFKHASLVPALTDATGSSDREAARYAFCALQNLSVDKSCRAPIAHTPGVIRSLTDRLRRAPGDGADGRRNGDSKDDDEDVEKCDAETRTAAVGALQNLSDEPANLIQFTIVKDCIGTIARVANGDVESGTDTDLIQFMAKNALASLSHWFRKIATSGSERMNGGDGGGFPPGGASPGAGGRAPRLFDARLVPTTYDQWE